MCEWYRQPDSVLFHGFNQSHQSSIISFVSVQGEVAVNNFLEFADITTSLPTLWPQPAGLGKKNMGGVAPQKGKFPPVDDCAPECTFRPSAKAPCPKHDVPPPVKSVDLASSVGPDLNTGLFSVSRAMDSSNLTRATGPPENIQRARRTLKSSRISAPNFKLMFHFLARYLF